MSDGLVDDTREPTPRVAIAHDYFTQRGGAERVALALQEGFGHGAIVTSVVERTATFPQLQSTRTSWLQRIPLAVRDPRAVLPLLPAAWSSLRITAKDADVVVASSTGFAHGVRSRVPKIVYCHNPPRWLYQPEDYLLGQPWMVRAALRLLRPVLRSWDQRAAHSADLSLATSESVARRIRAAYGLEPTVVHPPVTMEVTAP